MVVGILAVMVMGLTGGGNTGHGNGVLGVLAILVMGKTRCGNTGPGHGVSVILAAPAMMGLTGEG